MHLPADLSGGALFEVFEWTELPLRVQRLRVRDHTASPADKLIHRSERKRSAAGRAPCFGLVLEWVEPTRLSCVHGGLKPGCPHRQDPR